MNIFIYEFLTGGGFFSLDASPQSSPSLLSEGTAMATALAADFAAIEGTDVHLLRDVRVELAVSDCQIHEVTDAAAERACFWQLAAEADWTIVIAPEFDGLLAERCLWVRDAGGRLLGSRQETVELTSDKQRTVHHLSEHGIATPRGIAVEAGSRLPADFGYPAVLKPRNGAGSTDTYYLATAAAADTLGPLAFEGRLEEFQPGTPVSVAMLCGSEERQSLVPCLQRIADDGRFTYLGGSLPLENDLEARALRLAEAATATLTNPFGYIGVDMVLADDPADDVVLEINPRLTTSYIGLRAAANGNLAQAMLDVAVGRTQKIPFPSALHCDGQAVEFDADGTVRITTGSIV